MLNDVRNQEHLEKSNQLEEESGCTPRPFEDEHRKQLKSRWKLPDKAILQLEQAASVYKTILTEKHKYPTAKAHRALLLKLRQLASDLSYELKQLNPYVMRDLLFSDHQFGKHQDRLLVELESINRAVDGVKPRKDSSGNKLVDYDLLVYRIATIAFEHGIRPQKRGTKTGFSEIVLIVFKEMGLDDDSGKKVRQAIENSWNWIEDGILSPSDEPDLD